MKIFFRLDRNINYDIDADLGTCLGHPRFNSTPRQLLLVGGFAAPQPVISRIHGRFLE
jgi:hypothetical protein